MRSSYPTHPIQDQTAQTISATSYCKQKRVKSNIGSTPAPREPKALFEGIGHCIRGRTTCASSYNFPTGCYLAGGVSEFSANKRGHFEISYEQPTDNELLAVKLSVGSKVFFFIVRQLMRVLVDVPSKGGQDCCVTVQMHFLTAIIRHRYLVGLYIPSYATSFQYTFRVLWRFSPGNLS